MRPRLVWPAFLLCVGIIAAAMGWMTETMLRLERAEVQTVRQSENERLALWRMDSLVVPLVAQESARPASDYQAFVPAEAYSTSLSPLAPGEVHTPSSLLGLDSPYIRIHFQLTPSGEMTCPQVPPSGFRSVAEANYTTPERIFSCSAELETLQGKVSWDALCDAASHTAVLWTPRSELDADLDGLPVEVSRELQQKGVNFIEQQLSQSLHAQSRMQNTRNLQELQSRGRALATNSGVLPPGPLRGQKGAAPVPEDYSWEDDLDAFAPPISSTAPASPPNGPVRDQQPMRGVWVADSLLLVRRLAIGGEDVLQGCLLDWPQIEGRLLEEIEDLLPAARLVPVTAEVETDAVRPLMLASLPVRVEPGAAPPAGLPAWTPMRISLVTAWTGLVLAAVAVAALLLAAMRLSERRGAFVSAVTHELRTPLTTFQLYTEMLSEGMVPTQDKRRRYLETLRVEAARLGHLVENVLSYARLDGTRSRIAPADLPLGELLARVEQPLRDRAARDGMEIELAVPADPALVARGDAAAVERILFNLVDNACKYAAGAADRRIHIEARREAAHVVLRVRDHGRGIPPRAARRLFRPFSKSATEAAHSAPGIGLGLALCRRLARSMGGDLLIDDAVTDGACFALVLPAASH